MKNLKEILRKDEVIIGGMFVGVVSVITGLVLGGVALSCLLTGSDLNGKPFGTSQKIKSGVQYDRIQRDGTKILIRKVKEGSLYKGSPSGEVYSIEKTNRNSYDLIFGDSGEVYKYEHLY